MKLGLFLMIAVLSCSPASAQAPTQSPGSPPPPPQPNPRGPLYQHIGEQYRVYEFPGTDESIPYRLFVPSRWNPNTRLPLLVTLRAGTSINNSYRSQNDFVKNAEKRGYLVVTPMGYRPLRQPYYGSPYQIARPNAAAPAAGWTPLHDPVAQFAGQPRRLRPPPGRLLPAHQRAHRPVGVFRTPATCQVTREGSTAARAHRPPLDAPDAGHDRRGPEPGRAVLP